MKPVRRSSTISVPGRISGRPRDGDAHQHRGSGTANLPASGKVPNAKKPKARPPNTLREKIGFLHSSLPKYTGPYSVGTMDIEVPATRPSTNFSRITRNRQPLLRLDTVLFTLYYPTATPPSPPPSSTTTGGTGTKSGAAGAAKPGKKKSQKWSRPTWLPRPRGRVARGYGRFAGIGERTAVAWFGATTMFTKVPAWRNAPLAAHWPPFADVAGAAAGGGAGPGRHGGGGEAAAAAAWRTATRRGWVEQGEEGPVPPPFVVEEAGAVSEAEEREEERGEDGEWDEEWDGQAWERRKRPRFPLLVFSHGLGGNRTAYSSVCGEFASHGFVVCALEHRDGSGPRTYVNHPHEEGCVEASVAAAGARSEKGQKKQQKKGQCSCGRGRGDGGGKGRGKGTEQSNSGDGSSKIKKKERRQKPYDRIDYIFPKDNPIDTSPHAAKGVDRELRAAQTALRLAEIEEAYAVLRDIQHGHGARVAAANLRVKGGMGASSRGLEGVDWAGWKGRFHLRDVTVVGHSFGAATAVETLREEQQWSGRFAWVGQGIMYDVWGAAVLPAPGDSDGEGEVKEEAREPAESASSTSGSSSSTSSPSSSLSSSSTTLTAPISASASASAASSSSSGGTAISRPLLGINSEAFMYWPSNFRTATSLISSALSSSPPPSPSPSPSSSPPSSPACPAWLLTLRGTVHLSQSDFSLLYPGTCALLLKQTANPRRAMDLNVDASLEFLRRVLPAAHTNGLVRRMVGAVAAQEGVGVGKRHLGILDAPVQEEVPDVRRPEDKWIGGRLRVPHEFRSRVLPKLVRKVKRQKGRMGGAVGGDDGGGGAVAAAENEAWGEVWMHVRCPEDVLDQWERKRAEEGKRV